MGHSFGRGVHCKAMPQLRRTAKPGTLGQPVPLGAAAASPKSEPDEAAEPETHVTLHGCHITTSFQQQT